MNEAMTHERCSELLPAILRGDLTPEDAAAARTHLAGCEQCRGELDGLRLLQGVEAPAMNSEERDALHRTVAAALAHPGGRAAGDVIPLEGTRRAPRGARWLGAAAAVLVLGVGTAFALTLLVGGGAGDAAREGGADSGAGGSEALAAPDFAGPRPVFATSARALSDAPGVAAQESEDEQKAAGEAASRFTLALDSAEDLRRSARTSPLFAAFADAYDAADADELADTFLGLLVEDAGADPAAAQVEECGRQVLDASPSPILPVFAAPTRYQRERAFMLGFVTGDSALDRYTVWVWPEGSCARPVDSVFGTVRP